MAGSSFEFAHRIAFVPEQAETLLREIPARAGLFALRGERSTDQPYLMRAADLRRRLRRLLLPPESVDADGRPVPSKRLNLRDRVHSIEWTLTGSEFEGVLLLYRATHALFGEAEARRRLRLHCPYLLRVTMGHDHPRMFVSNKLSRRALRESFGPFASRASAERVADAVAEHFKLRRCHEDLEVHPDHPGCAYGEMERCLAPCKVQVSAAAYRAEAARVLAFLHTRGESLLEEIAAKREAASEAMDFEAAAGLHRQWERVKATAAGADPLIRAADSVRALIVQTAAPLEDGSGSEDASVFLLDHGRLAGPVRLSTRGVRAVREQTAVGSSLFAQPLMLSPVPEGHAPAGPGNGTPEMHGEAALAELDVLTRSDGEPEPSLRGDALALFKRWYYRPEKQRAGEVLLPNADGSWPVRKLLNAAARVVLGPPEALPPVERKRAKVFSTSADIPEQEATQGEDADLLPETALSAEQVAPKAPKGRRRATPAPGEGVLRAGDATR